MSAKQIKIVKHVKTYSYLLLLRKARLEISWITKFRQAFTRYHGDELNNADVNRQKMN